MPFALVIIGLLMIVTGSKNTYSQFAAQVKGDFTGPNNFTFWLASFGAVGAIGYSEKLRPLSRIFLVLLLVVMILANGGVFQKLTDALRQGPISPTPPDADPSMPGTQVMGGSVFDLHPLTVSPFSSPTAPGAQVLPNTQYGDDTQTNQYGQTTSAWLHVPILAPNGLVQAPNDPTAPGNFFGQVGQLIQNGLNAVFGVKPAF